MTTGRFLAHEVALLLAKYGKDAVLQELAKRMSHSYAELEAVLIELERNPPAARGRKKAGPADRLEAVVAQHPEKARQLRTLLARFDNRTFLPQLRDVRRFFEQHAHDLTPAKSRGESLPKMLKLLASLDVSELDALLKAKAPDEASSLGVLSDEILRRDGE